MPNFSGRCRPSSAHPKSHSRPPSAAQSSEPNRHNHKSSNHASSLWKHSNDSLSSLDLVANMDNKNGSRRKRSNSPHHTEHHDERFSPHEPLDFDAVQQVLRERINQWCPPKQAPRDMQTVLSNQKEVGRAAYRPMSASPGRNTKSNNSSSSNRQRARPASARARVRAKPASNRELCSNEALYQQVVDLKRQLTVSENENLKLKTSSQRWQRAANKKQSESMEPNKHTQEHRHVPPVPNPPTSVPLTTLVLTSEADNLSTARSNTQETAAVNRELQVKVNELEVICRNQLRVLERRDKAIAALDARLEAFQAMDDLVREWRRCKGRNEEEGRTETGRTKNEDRTDIQNPDRGDSSHVLSAQFVAIRRQSRYISVLEKQLIAVEQQVFVETIQQTHSTIIQKGRTDKSGHSAQGRTDKHGAKIGSKVSTNRPKSACRTRKKATTHDSGKERHNTVNSSNGRQQQQQQKQQQHVPSNTSTASMVGEHKNYWESDRYAEVRVSVFAKDVPNQTPLAVNERAVEKEPAKEPVKFLKKKNGSKIEWEEEDEEDDICRTMIK